MAGRPQNSPRGLFAKSRVDIGALSLTANSTAVTLSGGLYVSGKAKGLLSANSTGLIVGDALRVGTKAFYFTSNSTGVLLNSKYISTNTTGNATT